MQAIRTQIIVKQQQPETKTQSGIVLTQNHETTYGVVVSVGARVKEVKVGDKIVLNWNAAVQIKHENDTFYAVNSDAVYAVV